MIDAAGRNQLIGRHADQRQQQPPTAASRPAMRHAISRHACDRRQQPEQRHQPRIISRSAEALP